MIAFFRSNAVAAREALNDSLVVESRSRIRHSNRSPNHPDGKRPKPAATIQATGQNIFMLALDHLKKHRVVIASLPIVGEQPLTLEGVARRTSVDMVEATFLPGQIPIKRVDVNGTFRIFFEEEGRSFRLKAKIEEIIGGETLRVKAIETSLQYGEREYFRVDGDFTVKYRRLTDDEEIKTRQFSGRMNLSGGGMLLPINERVRNSDKFSLTLILSEDPLKVAHCIAQVVRICPLAEGRQGAGLHFTEIEAQDRDAIIAFCMAAQRLELRNKVQTKDLT